MLINKKFNYDILERVTFEDGNRYYVSPEGDHLSSVTTILSATSHSPELEAWQERVGLQEANRVRDEATGLGSLMHTHLENHVMGIERPGGSNLVRVMARNMADQIINQGLPNVNEVWGMEEILYKPKEYAGTSDLIGIHNGEEAIMDYKTSRKMKRRSMIQDYALQAAAYAQAHNNLYGTNIRKGVIFMVSRDLEFQEFVFEGDEFQEATKQWNNRLNSFLRLQEQKANEKSGN